MGEWEHTPVSRGLAWALGFGLVVLSALLALAVFDWQLGPEFLPAAPVLALLGLLFLGSARG